MCVRVCVYECVTIHFEFRLSLAGCFNFPSHFAFTITNTLICRGQGVIFGWIKYASYTFVCIQIFCVVLQLCRSFNVIDMKTHAQLFVDYMHINQFNQFKVTTSNNVCTKCIQFRTCGGGKRQQRARSSHFPPNTKINSNGSLHCSRSIAIFLGFDFEILHPTLYNHRSTEHTDNVPCIGSSPLCWSHVRDGFGIAIQSVHCLHKTHLYITANNKQKLK